jgi:fumarate hydratase, class II
MPATPPTLRTETDSFGDINVPLGVLWGAQTARSLRYFAIGEQPMPLGLIHAIAWVKWAAAGVNDDLNLIDEVRAKAISVAAQRVAEGEFDGEFPLSVWQTGSATQSHMNVNEVIASLANRWLDTHDHADLHVDAHDQVNLGQSSNDVVPSAMHLAVALTAKHRLLPAMHHLSDSLVAKALEFHEIVKIGRTHLQDATPVTLGQEFGGYVAQLALCQDSLMHALRAKV